MAYLLFFVPLGHFAMSGPNYWLGKIEYILFSVPMD